LSVAGRTYRTLNHQQTKDAVLRSRDKKPEFYKEQTRQWRRDNPEMTRASWRRHRTRKLNTAGSHSIAEWLDVVAQYGNACVYCGEVKTLHQDHILAVARGGSDWIENIVPACAQCNGRKGHRPLIVFLAKGRRPKAAVA